MTARWAQRYAIAISDRPITRPPTARQLEVVAAIRALTIAGGGLGPSIRELTAHFGVSSVNAMWCVMNALRRKGLLTYERGKSRTLRLREPLWLCLEDPAEPGVVRAGRCGPLMR